MATETCSHLVERQDSVYEYEFVASGKRLANRAASNFGAGSVFFVEGLPLGQIIILNATDTVDTSGFDELFDEGAVILASLNLPLPIAGKSGIHTLSYGWSSSRDSLRVGQDARILLPSVPIERTEDSWLVWWSGTQFLYEDPDDPMKGGGYLEELVQQIPKLILWTILLQRRNRWPKSATWT